MGTPRVLAAWLTGTAHMWRPGAACDASHDPLVLEHGSGLGDSSPAARRERLDYVQVITWDKGVGHIAGNVNGKTIRRFPVATEVCAFYQRRFEVQGANGVMPVQQWLRHEWRRAGLALSRANEACGVRNAATRKYLTQDWLWYWPPGEMIERLASYANEHGTESGWPYYSLDGHAPVGPARTGTPCGISGGTHTRNHQCLAAGAIAWRGANQGHDAAGGAQGL